MFSESPASELKPKLQSITDWRADNYTQKISRYPRKPENNRKNNTIFNVWISECLDFYMIKGAISRWILCLKWVSLGKNSFPLLQIHFQK